jgi:membrane protein YqaA with SNARE-associated domain
MKRWYKKFYRWSQDSSNLKWGPWILLVAGIADASFFPLPVTSLLVAFSLLRRNNRLKYVLFLTAGILSGSVIAYLTGHFAWLDKNKEFTAVANFFIDNIPGFSVSAYDKIHSLFTRNGSWILLSATATPLPYGLFSISSGVFSCNIILFMLITLAGHATKYFALTFLTNRIKPSFRNYFSFLLRPVTIIPVAAVVIAIAVIKII